MGKVKQVLCESGRFRGVSVIRLREGRDGNAVLLQLLDRHLDARFAWQLHEVLVAHLEAGQQLISLDLAQVESIDSSILATLIDVIRRMGPTGRVSICHAQPAVVQFLRRTGMHAILPMHACNDNSVPALAA